MKTYIWQVIDNKYIVHWQLSNIFISLRLIDPSWPIIHTPMLDSRFQNDPTIEF